MHASRQRWFVVAVFFFFMLLHQSDRLLIGTLTPDIMATFEITMTQMGAVSTGALIVGALFYPLWGYLYDRYGRAKLLALASFIWGATTWLNAIAPTFRAFLVTRAIHRHRRLQLSRHLQPDLRLLRRRRCAARSTACCELTDAARLPARHDPGAGAARQRSAGAACSTSPARWASCWLR